MEEVATWPTSDLHPDVRPGQAVEKLGFRFYWTTSHKTGAELQPYRLVGDVLADAVLDELRLARGDDSLEAMRVAAADKAHPAHDASAALLQSVSADPEWLDRAKLRRGQEVFIRYGAGSLCMLFYFSLVGGFGAPQINKVLTSTSYLNNEFTLRRLLETTQMVTDCLDAGALSPGGQGWSSCVRVRMLHARVRRRLRRMKGWDTAAWGVPINQEDMCATQLSFCFNVLLGLMHMGIAVTPRECEDYTHMWRYMGHLLGVVPAMNPCSSFFQSQAYMESIFMHVVSPDATSVRLAQNSLRAVSMQPPVYLPYTVNAQLARMLLGDAMADQLELPPNSPLYYCVHKVAFLAFVRLPAALSRTRWLGDAIMQRQLAGMKDIVRVGLGGQRTKFAMSHAPSTVLHGTEKPALRTGDYRQPPMSLGMAWLIVRRFAFPFVLLLLAFRVGIPAARSTIAAMWRLLFRGRRT